jgi:phenylacetate-coenzyme A ligase PaaK-like adenylate-forming protein
VETFKGFASSLENINAANFEDIALRVFRFQAVSNPVYAEYLRYLKVSPQTITSINRIPFLPIRFFKSHPVQSGEWQPQAEFTSSGTTGAQTSRHRVWSLTWYHQVAEKIFTSFFGDPSSYHILALLPSYLERTGSSLIEMMNHLIVKSRSEHSGYYLYNRSELTEKLERLRSDKRNVILWGVSFALLDLAETVDMDLSHCLIVETGGMKGRRKEIIRQELHEFLRKRFHIPHIISEYGMTELMSQAYAKEQGRFQCPAWMKIFIREINDPFDWAMPGRTGGINVIDLANFHSCSFIETEDIGLRYEDDSFEVLGRLDNSDIRGCNLLVA